MKRKATSQGASKFSKSTSGKFAKPKALRGEAPSKKKKQEVVEEVEDVEDNDFNINGDAGSESDGEQQVVDFYDDGEVSVNVPVSKKNLFDDSDEDEDEEVKVNMKTFTDDNKNWLKSKKSQASGQEQEDSEESSDEDSATIRELEEKAARKEAKRKQIEDEAKLDLMESIQKDQAEREEGESEEESEEEAEGDEEDRLGRLENLYGKIQESVGILTEWRERRPDGVSREEFVDKLKKDLMLYFGYTEFLMDLYFNLFTPAEVLSHIEANETPRPQTIRVNTLKAVRRDLAQTLINKGVTLEPIKWSKVGLVIYETKTIPIGATPEYLAGQYMLQSAASFLPVMALEPQPDEQVLDMCAAPGGKTTYIAAMMKNTGLIHANDKNEKRIPGLVANIHRMGVRNTVVTQYDGCVIPNYPTRYDRVLLDAPCMGLGVISKERGIKATKEEKDMLHCIDIQIRLLIAAIDSVDVSKAAVIVYSTCSISVEENEAIVNKALERRYVKVVDAGLPFGIEGITKYRGKEFHPSLKLARRYYPHAHNIDGFFVCKLHKYADGVRTKGEPKAEPKEEVKEQPKVNGKANGKTKEQPKPVQNAKKAKEPKVLFDEDRPQIDAAKEEQRTQKNKAKKARKRERKLARMRGGDDAGDDVDMEDLAPAKPAAKAAAKPAAKPAAKTNGKTSAKPAKPESDDDDVSDEDMSFGGDADMSDDDVSEEEAPKPVKPKAGGKGGRPNGAAKSAQKGGTPQRRLRGSKQ